LIGRACPNFDCAELCRRNDQHDWVESKENWFESFKEAKERKYGFIESKENHKYYICRNCGAYGLEYYGGIKANELDESCQKRIMKEALI
jgi:hypothetical protein